MGHALAIVWIFAVLLIACSSPTSSPSSGTSTNARPLATTPVTQLPAAPPAETATPSQTAQPETVEATPTATPEKPTTTNPPTATVALGSPSPTLTPTALPPRPTATSTSNGSTVVLIVTISEVPAVLPDYDRDDWKHWTGADGDCQDARNEVLVAESQTTVSYRTDRRCRVAGGEWLAPYSNTVVTDPGKLDVDHMVPLGNAHSSGASNWSAEQRERYANYLDDPQHLIAVTASANRSNGARGPEAWKPDDRTYWCQYAIDWVMIKDTWDLTATAAEFTALEEMLATCEVPHQLGVVFSMEKPDLPSFGGSTPRPTPTPVGGSHIGQYNSCDAAQAAGETRVQGSQGSGTGFPKDMVPSARDGDGDGVVCER